MAPLKSQFRPRSNGVPDALHRGCVSGRKRQPRAGFGVLAVVLCAFLIAASLPAIARPDRIDGDETCWALLNELAAAAIFAELPDEKFETIYALLDRLQDACEAQLYKEADEIRQQIETLVGK